MARRKKRPGKIRGTAVGPRAAAGTRRVLAGLSSDWYWEQDAQLRFTRVEVHTGTPGEQELAQRIIGKRRWETGIEIEGGWEAHKARLKARAPFREALMWRDFEDGARRYISVSGEPVFDAKGRFRGYRGIGRDITEQKRAKQRLRQSEERFRRTFELAGVGVAHVGMDGRFLRVNRRLCEILGYPESELVGRSVKEISHPDDRDVTDSHRARMHAGELDSVSFEKRYLRKDGTAVWVHLTVALERDAQGRPLHEISILDDITARKNAEAALRDSESRFRSLTDLSSDWFWEQDAEYRFTRLEGRFIAGGDQALQRRLIGSRRWETGLEIEGGWDAHRALLAARKPFHDVSMWRTMPDASLRFMSVSGEPVFAADGAFAGYRGVGRDVTAQKRAEQMLRLEHQVARALSEAENAGTGLTAVMRAVCEAAGWACGRYFGRDEAAGVLRFRQGWCVPGVEPFIERSRGLVFQPGQGLAGRVWRSGEPVWSADTPRDARVLNQALADGTGIRGAIAFPVISEGETIGVLAFSSQQVRQPDERLLQATRVIGSQVGQFLQRKQTEESLRGSEARFRSLTQMSSDFFWETDAQHRFTQLVHGAHYAGKVGRALIGKTAWEIPYTMPEESAWARLRAGLDARAPFRDFEFGRPWPDGSVRYFSVSGEPYFAADGSFLGFRGVGRDITEIALARERIASLAYSDALTGLANRTSLAPALEQAAERTRRRGSKLAGVFIDLDGFKPVNDAHGHDAGDRLLVEVARRLRASLRASDPVARLGGDEFFVVLEDMHDNTPVENVARKLLDSLIRPFEIAPGKEVQISASIGISVFPDDAGDAGTLIKHADMAMYSAKQAGRNAFRFFKSGAAANDPTPAAGRESV